MSITLYEAIDKHRISSMPKEDFTGQIVVVQTAESAASAVDYLRKAPILGIDTETRPSFHRGINYEVGLLQISTYDVCFLFRLCMIGMPDCLKELLSDKHQLKVGLSLQDDLRALRHFPGWTVGRYVDLQNYVTQFGIADKSLAKLYANVFGKRISKTQRLSNWEAPHLSMGQQRYAATDAWACIQIYERLEQLKQSSDYVLVARADADRLMGEVIKDMIEQHIDHE